MLIRCPVVKVATLGHTVINRPVEIAYLVKRTCAGKSFGNRRKNNLRRALGMVSFHKITPFLGSDERLEPLRVVRPPDEVVDRYSEVVGDGDERCDIRLSGTAFVIRDCPDC